MFAPAHGRRQDIPKRPHHRGRGASLHGAGFSAGLVARPHEYDPQSNTRDAEKSASPQP
ncbi:MAG: hypothetical protein MZV63_72105 [Marinilabiliales bacterium]|nr:hypothetical protein [Marinilabiliales bacterium]